jgi:hypothetical protein
MIPIPDWEKLSPTLNGTNTAILNEDADLVCPFAES